MNAIDRGVVLAAAGFNILVALFAIAAAGNSSLVGSLPGWVVGIGAVVSIWGLIVIVRDLYARQFENPNSKLTWLFVIMFTGGIGLIVYLIKHAWKPRVAGSPHN